MIRILTLVFAALACQSAAARDVADLYAGEAEVADRSAAELKRGARVALDQVLLKLTGSRRGAAAAGKAVTRAAADLLLQYAYEPQAQGDALVLKAQFDETALGTELDSLEVPIWGKERPDTAVWLVLDAGVSRQLISGDEPGLVGAAVLERARARGIPVLLPLMDIEESQHLAHAGDWAGLATTAIALSGRYRTPATLVGHLQQSGPGIWETRWRLQVGETQREWQESGDILELLLDDAVDALADTLAGRFADPLQLAQAEPLDLAILGVNSAADYARVATYLDGLDTVRDLFVAGVSNRALRVRFSARGGRAALARSIAFGRVLAPVEGQPDAYRLLP